MNKIFAFKYVKNYMYTISNNFGFLGGSDPFSALKHAYFNMSK